MNLSFFFLPEDLQALCASADSVYELREPSTVARPQPSVNCHKVEVCVYVCMYAWGAVGYIGWVMPQDV